VKKRRGQRAVKNQFEKGEKNSKTSSQKKVKKLCKKTIKEKGLDINVYYINCKFPHSSD
jgi:hypothetical protein